MLGLPQIFTLFFVTLGPLRLLGPFVQRTRGLDDATVRRIAWWTFVVAAVGIVTGTLIGRALLNNWHVSLDALRLAGGIVFFMVALRQLLEHYEPTHDAAAEPLPAAPLAAASQLVFPMVLTPYGVAAMIALLSASESTARTLAVFALALIVMVFDLVAMWFARRILVGFTIVALQVLGAVLAVLQVALSVEIILSGLRSLGVIQG